LLEKGEAVGATGAAANAAPPSGESPEAPAATSADRATPRAASNSTAADDEFQQTYSEEETFATSKNPSPNGDVDPAVSETFFSQAIDVDEVWDRVDAAEEAEEDALDSDGKRQSAYASVAADFKTKKGARKQAPKDRRARKKRGTSN